MKGNASEEQQKTRRKLLGIKEKPTGDLEKEEINGERIIISIQVR